MEMGDLINTISHAQAYDFRTRTLRFFSIGKFHFKHLFSATRTREQIAQSLVDARICGSIEEGLSLAPEMVGRRAEYGENELIVSRYTDKNGREMYKIEDGGFITGPLG